MRLEDLMERAAQYDEISHVISKTMFTAANMASYVKPQA